MEGTLYSLSLRGTRKPTTVIARRRPWSSTWQSPRASAASQEIATSRASPAPRDDKWTMFLKSPRPVWAARSMRRGQENWDSSGRLLCFFQTVDLPKRPRQEKGLPLAQDGQARAGKPKLHSRHAECEGYITIHPNGLQSHRNPFSPIDLPII